jgi:DNA-binding transcriptional regulator YiaG
MFVGGSRPAYIFSRPLNHLDYDSAYPKNPSTLAEHIRKFRKDKGLTLGELASELGVPKHTLRGWHSGRTTPRLKRHVRTLKALIPGAIRFFKSS